MAVTWAIRGNGVTQRELTPELYSDNTRRGWLH